MDTLPALIGEMVQVQVYSTKPDGLPPWMVAPDDPDSEPDDPDSELTSSIMIVISTIQTCHCMLL